ncbi:hypothetical protein ma847 [Moumouvirus australiensis]|uniref:Uncharacterized protein n=1 Tax=Moumouvirus australiensis TaxID=2109587 RepID=A0A2P1EMV2_9VIRU|nr:hypothetical protein QKC55_gp057 [Moumouvirus australiensis]AVL95234.1 hypothetical protein ma847 [Moumouvirus australiensis]
MDEFFVFVVYNHYYPSNAIFINLTKNSDAELKNKIDQLISIGSQIIWNIDKDQYFVEDKIIENKDIINYWRNLLSTLEHDHEGDIFSENFYDCCYYVYLHKNKYRSLSPINLQNKLMSKSKIKKNPIKVINSVMISETGFYKNNPMITLRYFVTGGEVTEKVLSYISKITGVRTILPAKKNTLYANYGYVKIESEYFDLFVNKIYKLDNINILFDEG